MTQSAANVRLPANSRSQRNNMTSLAQAGAKQQIGRSDRSRDRDRRRNKWDNVFIGGWMGGGGTWDPGSGDYVAGDSGPDGTLVAPDQGGCTIVTGSTAAADAELLLINPSDSPGSVNYTLDAAAYTLDVGYNQSYSGCGVWVIQFDRGVGGAQASYSLTPGTYSFAMTDQGWELYNTANVSFASASCGSVDSASTLSADSQTGQRLVLQNPQESGGSVSFLLDGNVYTLAAGSVQEVSITAPCLVEFDRGTGGAEARYTLAAGSYTFSVSDNGWELYSLNSTPGQ
jgi:hypothetical protein